MNANKKLNANEVVLSPSLCRVTASSPKHELLHTVSDYLADISGCYFDFYAHSQLDWPERNNLRWFLYNFEETTVCFGAQMACYKFQVGVKW